MPNTQNAGSKRQFTRYLIRKDEPTSFMSGGLLPAIGLGLVLLFGFIPFAFGTVQATAKSAADNALARANADWADAKVSGQWITLEGVAPSNTAARAAERAVREATSPGLFGLNAYPVTRVRNASTAPAAKAPTIQTVTAARHDWAFTLDRSVLELSGDVPDEPTRAAILNAAQLRIDPPRLTAVESRLRITGKEGADGFTETALRGVNTLGRCDAGVSSFTDSVFSLSCEAGPSISADITQTANAALPTGTIGRVDVYTKEAAETCNQALLDILTTTRIEFASGSAVIDPASANLLDRVATAATTCPGTLRVEGHTDTSGRSNLNERLSSRRALAVRRALIDRGVSSGRLTAQGYGASRPVADNSTPQGRARNRRIEIKVAATGN